MKKFTNYFVTLSLAVAALFTTTSCNEDADVEIEVANPSISAIDIAESSIGQTSATATVTFAEAEEIYYSVYESSSSASTWESVAVDATATSTSIKLSSLTAGTDYTVECYAVNGDIKSTSLSADFTTVDADVVIPDPTIAIAAVEGGETIQFTVSVTNAVMYAYAYYLTSETPSEIAWTEVVVEADGDYTIDVDATVAGDYTICAYAAGTEVDTDVVSATFTVVAPDPTIAIAAVEGSESQFVVSVTDAVMYAYAYYLTAEAPSEALIEWSEVAVSEDGDYTIEVVADAGEYTLFAYAGGMSANSEVVSIAFSIAEPVVISISNINAASLMISMDVEVDLSLCDGFAYYDYPTAYAEYYVGYFEGDLAYGYAEEYVTESRTQVFGSDYYLNQNTSYTFEIAAYKENGDGTYSIVGDIITVVEATTAAAIGTSDVTIDIVIDDTMTSLTGFGGTIYNNDNIGGYYYGDVAIADAASGVEAYITANNVVSSAYYTTFRTYDWTSGGYIFMDSKSFTGYSKSAGTDYYAYAIPVDNNGNLGKVCYTTVTTSTLNVDPTIIPGIECTPGTTTAEFVFTFTDNCYKIFRYNGAVDSSWVTADSAYSYFLSDLTSMYYGWSKDSADVVDGKVSYTQSWLSMGTAYNMYYLGVAEDGTLGEIQTYTYTTSSPSFGASSASLNVTIDADKSQAYYWYDPAEYPDYTDSVYAEVTFNIEMIDGATSYIYGVFDKSYVYNQTSMDAFGTYLIGSYWNPITTTATVLENLYFGYSSYILTVVPVDADGVYGTPQVIEYDGWDNPIYGSSDSDDDYGVDPL